MLFYSAKDHRGRTVPIIGPGWRVLWPFDREIDPEAHTAAYFRAANAVPIELRRRLCGWCVLLLALVAFLVIYLTRGNSRVGPFNDPTLFIWALSGAGGGMSLRREWHMIATRVISASLADHYCPSCGYSLATVPEQPDHCRICPECGAAWCLSYSDHAMASGRSR